MAAGRGLQRVRDGRQIDRFENDHQRVRRIQTNGRSDQTRPAQRECPTVYVPNLIVSSSVKNILSQVIPRRKKRKKNKTKQYNQSLIICIFYVPVANLHWNQWGIIKSARLQYVLL